MNRLDYMIDWSNRVTELSYDEVGRLRFIDRPNGTQRDKNGNIEKQLTVPLPQTQTINPVNATYNDDNSLATFNGLTIEHDDDGNMTNGPILEDSLHTYTYDSCNRLTSAGGISSTYDAHNNLIAQDDWQYTVNPNSALSQILKAQNGSDIRHYIYGTGLLYEEKSDGSTITYHFDHLGNTVALTDDSGNIISRKEYTPYGITSYETGTHDTPFWYGGRYGVITANNGLMSMRARWYNPYLRRFINQDPIGFEGGLNWFDYADGNPLNMIDPFGLDSTGINEQDVLDSYEWLLEHHPEVTEDVDPAFFVTPLPSEIEGIALPFDIILINSSITSQDEVVRTVAHEMMHEQPGYINNLINMSQPGAHDQIREDADRIMRDFWINGE